MPTLSVWVAPKTAEVLKSISEGADMSISQLIQLAIASQFPLPTVVAE